MPRAPETLAPPLLVRGQAGALEHWFAGGPQFKVTPLVEWDVKLYSTIPQITAKNPKDTLKVRLMFCSEFIEVFMRQNSSI